MQNQLLGQKAENLAQNHLLNKGYQLVTKNFRTKFGEIDLIFMDNQTTVFVEVKARHRTDQGMPEEAVNRQKLAKITKVAEYFLQHHPQLPQLGRIDVIAIDFNQSPPVIRHFKNVT